MGRLRTEDQSREVVRGGSLGFAGLHAGALDGADRGVGGDAGADDAGDRAADLVGVRLDPELLDVGQAVVEGPLSQKSSSEQPMQPWPDWIGKDTPSFQRVVEQAL